MRILILHRIPFRQIDYASGIDHERHEVTYVGIKERIEEIPASLKCSKIVRPGILSTSEEVVSMKGLDTSFDQVISLSEYELLEAAKIREAWNIGGSTVSEVLIVRDKVLMKEKVQLSGIKTPWHLRCSEISGLPQSDENPKWQQKTVLKPTDGAASINISVFMTLREAVNYVQAKVKAGELDPSSFQYEEFIDGRLIHIDGMIADNVPIVMDSSYYVGTPLSFAGGLPIGSVQFDLNDDLREWTSKVLSSVGIQNGCFHLEAFLTKKGPVFIEVGARHGGGNIPDVFKYRWGIHLPTDELALYTGRYSASELKEKVARWKNSSPYFGFVLFPGHKYEEGSTCRLKGIENWVGHPNVLDLNVIDPSTRLTQKIVYNSNMVPLTGNVCGSSPEVVEALIRSIISSVQVEVIHEKITSSVRCSSDERK